MANTATWSIRTVIKDDTKSGISRLKSTLAAEMPAIEKVMADPFSAATREVNVLATALDKVVKKSTSNKLISDRDLSDLTAIEAKVKNIAALLATLPKSQQGGLVSHVDTLTAALTGVRETGILKQRPTGSIQKLNTNGIIDFEIDAALTRPAFIREDPEVRSQRIQEKLRAIGANNVRLSGERLDSYGRAAPLSPAAIKYAKEENERFIHLATDAPSKSSFLYGPSTPEHILQAFGANNVRLAGERLDSYGKVAPLSPAAIKYAKEENERAEEEQRRLNDHASREVRLAGERLDSYGRAAPLSPAVIKYAEEERNRFINLTTDAPLKSSFPYGPFTPEHILQDRASREEWVKRLSLRQEKGDVAYGSNINKNSFNDLNASLRVQALKSITAEYKQQDAAVEAFIKRFSSLNDKQLHAEQTRVQIAKKAGYNVDARGQALDILQNPFHPRNTGGRSSDHALRYGAQNAAFALEDFLISSQYGGPAAGFRAITNNMTAIAAAAGTTLTPLASAGIIGTAALAGVGLGYAADTVSGMGISEADRAAIRKGTRLEDKRTSTAISLSQFGYGDNTAKSSLVSLLTSKNSLEHVEARYTANDKALVDTFRKRTSAFMGDTDLDSWGAEKTLAAYDSYFGWLSAVAIGNFKRGASVSISPYRTEQQIKEFQAFKEREKEFAEINKELYPEYELKSKEFEKAKAAFYSNMKSDASLYSKNYDTNRRLLDLSFSESQGKLVDPEQAFTLNKIKASRQYNLTRSRLKTDEEKEQLFQEFEQEWETKRLEMNHVLKPSFSQALKSRDRQHRLILSEAERDPSKRINTEFDLKAESIRDSEHWTQGQKDEQLSALEKRRKQALDAATQMPSLGMAVDVGSVADLSLRQKYFDRGPASDDAAIKSEKHLETLVEKVRLLTEAVKANKVPVKSLDARM